MELNSKRQQDILYWFRLCLSCREERARHLYETLQPWERGFWQAYGMRISLPFPGNKPLWTFEPVCEVFEHGECQHVLERDILECQGQQPMVLPVADYMLKLILDYKLFILPVTWTTVDCYFNMPGFVRSFLVQNRNNAQMKDCFSYFGTNWDLLYDRLRENPDSPVLAKELKKLSMAVLRTISGANSK